VLLEGDRCGWGASGRNGGFAEASLTHGLENGLSRWPDEMDTIERLGAENFAAMRETLEARGIDAAWEEPGVIDVATRPHEVQWLAEAADAARQHGEEVTLLDREAVRAEVDSPTYLGGLWHQSGGALVDPATLAWGLREAARGDGVRIHEHTRVTNLRRDGEGVLLETPAGRLRARRVLLATNAYKPLVRSIRRYVVPVYDYVLVTEPLSDEQRRAIGWSNRQGISDSGNRFHYYRLTPGDGDRLTPADGDRLMRAGEAPAERRSVARAERPPESSGAVTRRFTTSATACGLSSRTMRARSSCWRATSRRRFRSSRAFASLIAGRARSIRAAASASRSAARSAGGRRMRSAIPGWGSSRAGLARGWRSICCMNVTPS
jgi:glycine/D-amino acid oxidase-like deaminating enzyme